MLYNLSLSDILYTYILGKTLKAKELSLKYHDFRVCVWKFHLRLKKNNMAYMSTPSMERRE